MSRQTPTSRRSPSILVTDVRHQKAHSAPFVSRRLNAVSVDSLLSNTSEVPSAQRRATPRHYPAMTSTTHGNSTHRSRMAGGSRRDEATGAGASSSSSIAVRTAIESNRPTERTPLIGSYNNAGSTNSNRSSDKLSVKPVPRLSKPLPSRQSKQSQRLVLIPNAEASTEPSNNASASSTSSHGPHSSNHSPDDGDSHRVTSYLISEGILLSKAAAYLKSQHRARVRLYGEALFADYLLPILPGDGVDYRIQSSVGDNRTMERMIDISEQKDHHFEYFAATTEESDPSEPQDFSPRPGHGVHKPSRRGSNGGSGSGPVSSRESGDSGTSGNEGSSEFHGGSSRSGSNGSTQNAEISETPEQSHKQVTNTIETARRLQSYLSHAEIFLFNYGVVVFWNFTEAQEKQVLADLCIGNEDLVVKPCGDQDIQSEELRFKYALDMDTKPRIFNDLITLNSNSHMLKLAMSHAMAQSTILCCFEDRMQANLNDVRGVPKRLALTGKLGMNREQLLKISGRLFKLRVDVNLSSNVLDIPEFFWDSEPSLFPLFNALREYLEIDERVLVLNERQSVFLELTSILSDSIAEFNMDRITIIVIWLIVLSICVSLTEIAVRFLILKKAGG